VQTGLHRKWVAAWLAERDAQVAAQSGMAVGGGKASARKRSMASQLLMHWVKCLDTHPERVSLPLSPATGVYSFTDLAREAVKHVHPRSVLDELVRLGLAREAEGMVHLLAEAFVPQGSQDERLALWANNARALIATGCHNTTQDGPTQMERAIWGEGISAEDALAVQALARVQWAQMQARLHERIATSAQVNAGRHRVHVGAYVHIEPMSATTPARAEGSES
jgi:hypothetical protein